jgi:REP element-mobilizing transposase RayT
MEAQLALKLKTWGGRRKGAGRKPNGDKAGVSHLRRPKVSRHTPLHVTLRLCSGLPNLRSGALSKVVFAALAAGKLQDGFALVHYSIQSNHLHLLIEAGSSKALGRGMKALGTRLGRAINRCRGEKGKVFADRYHVHVLRTPREVRHALSYVLCNFRKHGSAGKQVAFDACSSTRTASDTRRSRVANARAQASTQLDF